MSFEDLYGNVDNEDLRFQEIHRNLTNQKVTKSPYPDVNPTTFVWTPYFEKCLLACMIGHKPCGINKHLHMMMIREKLCHQLKLNIPSKLIWKYLGTKWNMEVADEIEVKVLDSHLKPTVFDLPDDIKNILGDFSLQQDTEEPNHLLENENEDTTATANSDTSSNSSSSIFSDMPPRVFYRTSTGSFFGRTFLSPNTSSRSSSDNESSNNESSNNESSNNELSNNESPIMSDLEGSIVTNSSMASSVVTTDSDTDNSFEDELESSRSFAKRLALKFKQSNMMSKLYSDSEDDSLSEAVPSAEVNEEEIATKTYSEDVNLYEAGPSTSKGLTSKEEPKNNSNKRKLLSTTSKSDLSRKKIKLANTNKKSGVLKRKMVSKTLNKNIKTKNLKNKIRISKLKLNKKNRIVSKFVNTNKRPKLVKSNLNPGKTSNQTVDRKTVNKKTNLRSNGKGQKKKPITKRANVKSHVLNVPKKKSGPSKSEKGEKQSPSEMELKTINLVPNQKELKQKKSKVVRGRLTSDLSVALQSYGDKPLGKRSCNNKST